MSTIIDGLKYSKIIKEEILEEVKKLNITPGLAVIIVGDDPASNSYVGSKIKSCEQVAFYSRTYKLPSNTSQADLLNLINTLSKDDNFNGILIQLPLPKHIDERIIIESIPTEKDVDCFSYNNLGKLFSKKSGDFTDLILPCTPAGIIELFDRYAISLTGKNVAVVGRSNIVGKPLAIMLTLRDATVTLCHSKTKNLKSILSDKDIVISAIGSQKFIKKDMIKKDAVVIDVGTNLDNNGKFVGDLDFEELKDWVSFITPVPKGVGPMTIAMLMKNTLKLAKKAKGLI